LARFRIDPGTLASVRTPPGRSPARTTDFDTLLAPVYHSRPVELQAGGTARNSLEFFPLSRPLDRTANRRQKPRGPTTVNSNKPTYLSRDGLEKLRTELQEMTTVKRPEVAQRIHDAKEHGDLSENAEYEDAKNEQAFVEGRIQTLEALIKNATIIDEHHSTDHVQIGSTVAVESPDGKESFTIVGSTEARPNEGRISNESPVGRALLGKKKGEKVLVRVPAGDFTYKITAIS
jgi:transcription elongation factor GreA